MNKEKYLKKKKREREKKTYNKVSNDVIVNTISGVEVKGREGQVVFTALTVVNLTAFLQFLLFILLPSVLHLLLLSKPVFLFHMRLTNDYTTSRNTISIPHSLFCPSF